jgi:RES domain-containing protein
VAHSLWRIAADTPDYGADDLSGLGAQKSGGRWNRKGTPVVYASHTIALACLETVVNLGGSIPLPLNRYLVRIDVPEDAWTSRTVFDPSLHTGWDAVPPGLVSLDRGTMWAKSNVSLLLEVPSVVVPEERNVLINPAHPTAATLVAKKVRRWTYDGRLA